MTTLQSELHTLRHDVANWRRYIQEGGLDLKLTGEQRVFYVSELLTMEIALNGITPAAYVEVARGLIGELVGIVEG